MAQTNPEALASKLKDLALKPSRPKSDSKKQAQEPVADSWEDEAEGDDDDDDDDDNHSSSTDRGVDDSNHELSPTPITDHSRSPSDPIAVPSTSQNTHSLPNGAVAPPPTPSSPYGTADLPHTSLSPLTLESRSPASSPSWGPRKNENTTRPEKTNAVANRMIAGALGVKAPKRTEEQKAYDKAMREKELRRKTEEKERQRKEAENIEKAKKAIWDD